MKRRSCWTGHMEVSIAGKTIFHADEREVSGLFQTYEKGVHNTISKECAALCLQRAKALQQELASSIKDLKEILDEYNRTSKLEGKD